MMLARIGALALGFAGMLLAASPAAAQADEEPLPRFEDAVCPGVAGLKRDAAEMLVDRIRADALAFGRRLAPAGTCEPNLIVAFVNDSGEFMHKVQQENGWLFAELNQADRAVVFDEAGPARTLLRVRARTRDGMPIPRRENLTDLPETTLWMAHSKIYGATRNDIINAMILFDRNAVRGMTLTQLADYATFRAFTRMLPQTPDTRADSIVSLFDGGSNRPAELTAFDRAYLGTLYAGMPNMPAPARLAELEKATGRDIFIE
jgi:hypothetical protein